MKVKDVMKQDVASISVNATLGDASKLMIERHVGTLPVIDEAGKLVGILQMRDLHTLVMPDFVRLIEDFDFVHTFGAVSTREPLPGSLDRKISAIMHEPIFVEETCGLLRASALLHSHHVLDLPVVDKNHLLVGIASRVDIGTALMEDWHHEREVE